MNWVDVCKKYVGMRYDGERFNCRHLAASAFTDLTGFNANSIFGIGSNEGKLKILSRSNFKRYKSETSALSVLILRDSNNNTHVAIKNGNEVLHNFGDGHLGCVCLSRWETIQRQYKDFQFWVLE